MFRREFLTRSILASAGISTVSNSLAGIELTGEINPPKQTVTKTYPVNIFSKNLQWLDYISMASAAAEMGFDGIDLTVRPDGHVLPERVAEDLPKAVEAIRKAGLNVVMITTAINNADDPLSESILKAASVLGIQYYRMGWMSYDNKIPMEGNLRIFRERMTKLAALNKKYNIHGDYQNHSGTSFGSPVWDLWMILKDLDPEWIGSQYDIYHAMVEANNSWPLGLKLLKSHIRTMDIKDFAWAKKENRWTPVTVPLGEGAVDFKKYLSLIKEYNIRGPFSMHYEYPIGGAEHGARTITMKMEEVLDAMKRDLVTFRKFLSEAEIS
jgi:sugar phosphate isomerase/epimerase